MTADRRRSVALRPGQRAVDPSRKLFVLLSRALQRLDMAQQNDAEAEKHQDRADRGIFRQARVIPIHCTVVIPMAPVSAARPSESRRFRRSRSATPARKANAMPGRVAWLMASDQSRLRRNGTDHSAADTEGDYAGQHHGCVIPGTKVSTANASMVISGVFVRIPQSRAVGDGANLGRRQTAAIGGLQIASVKTSVTGPPQSGDV